MSHLLVSIYFHSFICLFRFFFLRIDSPNAEPQTSIKQLDDNVKKEIDHHMLKIDEVINAYTRNVTFNSTQDQYYDGPVVKTKDESDKYWANLKNLKNFTKIDITAMKSYIENVICINFYIVHIVMCYVSCGR